MIHAVRHLREIQLWFKQIQTQTAHRTYGMNAMSIPQLTIQLPVLQRAALSALSRERSWTALAVTLLDLACLLFFLSHGEWFCSIADAEYSDSYWNPQSLESDSYWVKLSSSPSPFCLCLHHDVDSEGSDRLYEHHYHYSEAHAGLVHELLLLLLCSYP